jgi:hypothetical protein
VEGRLVASERERLGDFEIVRETGRGGMGVVYEAIQLSLNRKVALKVLPPGTTPEQRDIERFQREAQGAAQLDHPNIVPIYAQGEHVGTYSYAMQYIEGRSLGKVITDAGGLDFSSVTPGQFARTLTADTGAAFQLEETVPTEGAEGTAPEVPPGRITDLDRRYFRTAARMVAEVAEALEYAHGEGVIHRDIKPHNLMLTSEGRLMRVERSRG